MPEVRTCGAENCWASVVWGGLRKGWYHIDSKLDKDHNAIPGDFVGSEVLIPDPLVNG